MLTASDLNKKNAALALDTNNKTKKEEILIPKILKGHTGPVYSVSLSRDNDLVVSGGEDCIVRIWSLSKGICVQELHGHDEPIKGVAIGSDNDSVVSGGEDCTVRVWSLSKGVCVRELRGHDEPVNSVDISADNDRVISSSEDGSIQIWSALKGAYEKELSGHTGSVTSTTIGSGNDRIVSGSSDYTVRVWSILKSTCIKTFETQKGFINSVAISLDNNLVASGSDDRMVRVWSLLTGDCIKIFEGHKGDITSVSIAPNNDWVISSSLDKTVRIWSISRGVCLKVIDFKTEVLSVKPIKKPDNLYIIAGLQDGTIQYQHGLNLSQLSLDQATSLNFTAPAATRKHQIDVSNLGNNCGLFALFLGTKRAFDKINDKTSNVKKSSIPKQLSTLLSASAISESDLTQQTTITKNLGKALRIQLINALSEDQGFKEGRRESYSQLCVNFCQGKPLPFDMEAFTTNTILLSRLKNSWVKIDDNLKSFRIANFSKYYSITNPRDDIAKLQKEIKRILRSLDAENSNSLLEKFVLENIKITNGQDLIRYYVLYHSAWQGISITDGSVEQRQSFQSYMEESFKGSILILLEKLKKQEGAERLYLECLFLFALLKRSAFTVNGQIKSLPVLESDVIEDALYFFVEQHLLQNWENIYASYLNVLSKEELFLSADELGCLARRWQVQLLISFSTDRAPYRSYAVLDSNKIQVTLCNPLRVHWMVEEEQTYRHLNEFYDFLSLKSALTFCFGIRLNEVRIAKEKNPKRSADFAYSDTYHIALRHGEFHAQVDKAFSELHKFFLGYGPDIDIIQDGNDFYVASRTIRNLIHGFEGFAISPDGKISKQIEEGKKTKYFRLIHLASFVALAYFFGYSDIHSGNWGVQENGEELWVYKIDDPDALDDEALSVPLSKSFMISLGFPPEDLKEQTDFKQSAAAASSPFCFSFSDFLKTKEFGNELKAMFIKIAQTKFQSIKEILQTYITADPIGGALWRINTLKPLLNKSPKDLSESSGTVLQACSEFLKNLKESFDALESPEGQAKIKQYSLAHTMQLLESRHKQLQVILNIQSDLCPKTTNENSNTKAAIQNQNAQISVIAPITPSYHAATAAANDNKTNSTAASLQCRTPMLYN